MSHNGTDNFSVSFVITIALRRPLACPKGRKEYRAITSSVFCCSIHLSSTASWERHPQHQYLCHSTSATIQAVKLSFIKVSATVLNIKQKLIATKTGTEFPQPKEATVLPGDELALHSLQIIRCALSVNAMDALLLPPLLTTSFHTRETNNSFGMNQTGNRFAKAVMTERQR